MASSNIAATSGIKAKDKIGYLMGDFGSLCVFGLVQSVLQRYYTDILQINIVSIMTMMIVARIWDAINDPIWGRIIDGAKPGPDGRYRRWIKIFAVPVAVSAVLMFIKIPGLTQGQYLAYAYVTYILFGCIALGIREEAVTVGVIIHKDMVTENLIREFFWADSVTPLVDYFRVFRALELWNFLTYCHFDLRHRILCAD